MCPLSPQLSVYPVAIGRPAIILARLGVAGVPGAGQQALLFQPTEQRIQGARIDATPFSSAFAARAYPYRDSPSWLSTLRTRVPAPEFERQRRQDVAVFVHAHSPFDIIILYIIQYCQYKNTGSRYNCAVSCKTAGESKRQILAAEYRDAGAVKRKSDDAQAHKGQDIPVSPEDIVRTEQGV